MPDLARKLTSGATFEELPGLSYRRNAPIVHNPTPTLVDVNAFLPKNYGGPDPEHYSIGHGLLHHAASISCPFQCSFCGPTPYFKRGWFGLDPARVVQEIKAVAEKHEIREVAFWDFDFFIDLARVKEILRGLLAERLGFSWFALRNISRAGVRR